MKTIIYIDVNNLYTTLMKEYKLKIRYEKLLIFLRDLGEIDYIKAYITKRNEKFEDNLRKLGIDFEFSTNPALDISFDILHDEHERIVICSNDINMERVINMFSEKRFITVGVGCQLPIPRSVMEGGYELC